MGRRGGSVIFRVLTDGNPVYTSPLETGGQSAEHVTLDVTGVNYVILYADDNGGNGADHSDWAGAQVTCASPPPVF
jgi:hypothetical protein